MNFIWIAIIALIALELFLIALVHYLKKDFQWLITIGDSIPEFNPIALKDFLKTRYSPELGWVMKPNISKKESIGSIGALTGHTMETIYNINSNGSRSNTGHEHFPNLCSTFGDSYTFCRQVNDEESWQWYLSSKTQINISNFGVGNYGVDQALLRLKMEYDKNPSQTVILQAVPETIVRIHSIWKHYCEFGNSFAFKPRFIIDGEKMHLLQNPIDDPSKFANLHPYLSKIKEEDFFYKKKFLRYAFKFPYTVSLIRNLNRNVPLIFYLIIRKLAKPFGVLIDKPWEIILKDNERSSIELHQNEKAVKLLTEILKEFVAFSQTRNFKPIFLLLPFKSDLEFFKKEKNKYYSKFIVEASKYIQIIDLTEHLASFEEDLYTNKFYGGHLNASGNKIVADYLYSLGIIETESLKCN